MVYEQIYPWIRCRRRRKKQKEDRESNQGIKFSKI